MNTMQESSFTVIKRINKITTKATKDKENTKGSTKYNRYIMDILVEDETLKLFCLVVPLPFNYYG